MRFTVEDQLYNHGFLVQRVMLSPEGILITMVVVGESESSDDFHVAPAQRTSFMKSAFESERALMNTSFFLSTDAIAEDAGGEGEESAAETQVSNSSRQPHTTSCQQQ
jgi:hypothetical protein